MPTGNVEGATPSKRREGWKNQIEPKPFVADTTASSATSPPRWQADAPSRVEIVRDNLEERGTTEGGADLESDQTHMAAGSSGLTGAQDKREADIMSEAGPRCSIQVGRTPDAGDAGKKGALFLLPGQIPLQDSTDADPEASDPGDNCEEQHELQQGDSPIEDKTFRGPEGDALDFKRKVLLLLREHRFILFQALRVRDSRGPADVICWFCFDMLCLVHLCFDGCFDSDDSLTEWQDKLNSHTENIIDNVLECIRNEHLT